MLRHLRLATLSLLALGLLAACHTVHGAGHDIEDVGEEIQEESEEHD
jgi:predicted small secreted protein